MINYETYCKIIDYVSGAQLNLVQTARTLDLDARTVAKWAKCSHYRARRNTPRSSRLDPFKDRVLLLLEGFPYSAQQIHRRLCEEGFDGGLTIVKDYVHTIRANGGHSFDGFAWMLAVLQKQISSEDLKQQISDLPDLDVLLDRLYTGRLRSSQNLAIG